VLFSLYNYQAAYRSGFSAETAILQVLSDSLLAGDDGDVVALALFDMSTTAFTVII